MSADNETSPNRRSDALFFLAAIVVGALAGVVGTALHLGVNEALAWPTLLKSGLDQAGVAIGDGGLLLLTGCISAIMVLASVWLVRNFAPEASGSGVQEIEGAMVGLRQVRWRRILPVKFASGFLSLSSGLVLGREGPTIHLGASIAQAASQWLKLPTKDGYALLAAGGAAGLAAAFSAPLASILFVIEETRRQFPYSLKTYTGVMFACVMSGIVTQELAGVRPFMAIDVPVTPLGLLPAFVGLGVVLGVAGVVFNRCLVRSMDFARALGNRSSFYIFPALAGFAVGILLVLNPDATKGGETLVVSMATANLALTSVAVIVLIRFVMTMISYSTGVPGGIFAPILALATAMGLLYGLILEAALPLPPGAVMALGVAAMGGLFASTIRAPLVGVVLIAELTGSYDVLLPTLITAMVANIVADWLGGRPIYEVLLERTLRQAGETPPAPIEQPQTGQRIGGWDQR